MTANPNFYFDEIDMAGIDYCSPEVGRDYDQGHQRFRDYEAEANEAIELLGLDETSLVLDMGAGTGAFALHAARRCAQVIAVDISPSMLQWCREKAAQMGLTNLTIVQAGFLSYRHEGPPVNAVISNVALHHLPDHWKQVALDRLVAVIEPGGRLLLQDVVFPSGQINLDESIAAWLGGITQAAGPEMGQEAVVHVKNEFSTYDWIMEGMLRRAGFNLETVGYRDGFLARYLGRRSWAEPSPGRTKGADNSRPRKYHVKKVDQISNAGRAAQGNVGMDKRLNWLELGLVTGGMALLGMIIGEMVNRAEPATGPIPSGVTAACFGLAFLVGRLWYEKSGGKQGQHRVLTLTVIIIFALALLSVPFLFWGVIMTLIEAAGKGGAVL